MGVSRHRLSELFDNGSRHDWPSFSWVRLGLCELGAHWARLLNPQGYWCACAWRVVQILKSFSLLGLEMKDQLVDYASAQG